MQQAYNFNPSKIILKLDGKEYTLKKFSLEHQLSVAMRFSENKGVEHGIKKLSEILAHPEKIAEYNNTVTEIIYGLLSPDSKRVEFPTVCRFRDSIYAEAEDLKGSDRVSKMAALTMCLNAAVQNSQPVMDEARTKLENENLKKKLIQKQMQIEKILGSQHLLNSQKSGRFHRLRRFMS